MKKRHITVIISVLATYLGALALLVYAESFSPDASILTMKDAVWYSIVTLTTVGYGDLSPVTAAGKIIGAVFLLLSTSLLAMLLALIMTFGQVIARFRLSLSQGKKWYVFSTLNSDTANLAQGIAGEDKNAVLIFPKDEEDSHKEIATQLKKQGALFIKGAVTDILELKKSAADTHIFFMDADGWENYRGALALSGNGYSIYCQTDFQPLELPADITLFSPYEICGRLYWQTEPLPMDAENVVIIGGGNYANALLEQALQVNVFAPDQSISYYLMGDNHRFKNLHPQLSQLLATDEKAPATDSIFYMPADWAEHADVIAQADRVLLWADNDEENLKNYSEITKYFALKGKLHLRLSYNLPGADCHGNHRQLYTPALVMRAGLNGIAQAMHQIYLESTGTNSPEWEQLSAFTRNSNISAADHLRTKIRILLGDSVTDVNSATCRAAYDKFIQTKQEKADFYRWLEHNRWMRFHAIHNWVYNPQRNNAMRQHPSMVAFDLLDKNTQAKDDYSWQLLAQLSDFLKD